MNLQKLKQKLTLRRIVLLLLCLGAFMVYGENFGYPFKVTDPADPRFKVERFSFYDYWGDRELLQKTFRILFPPGTNKTFVDKVLIEYGGARILQNTDKTLLWFYEPPDSLMEYAYLNTRGPFYKFYFDENGNLLNIITGTGQKLYGDLPSPYDIE